jgi:glycosyltransferase involved in cell wall biosynthesis
MQEPFFTIIIPTLNSSKTIQKTIESVLMQSFSSYEVLVIDGFSTDNTLALIKAFNSPRIHLCKEYDKGVYDAMNKGIAKAAGEWIYFLGSDDYLLNSRVLQTVHEHIAGMENIDMVYGDVESNVQHMVFKGAYSLERLNAQNICHQAMFFRRQLFIKMGSFDLKYKILSDWHFNIRLFAQYAHRTRYINVPVAFFTAGGVSSLDEPEFQKWRVKFYKKYFMRKNSANNLIFSLKYSYDAARNFFFRNILRG